MLAARPITTSFQLKALDFMPPQYFRRQHMLHRQSLSTLGRSFGCGGVLILSCARPLQIHQERRSSLFWYVKIAWSAPLVLLAASLLQAIALQQSESVRGQSLASNGERALMGLL